MTSIFKDGLVKSWKVYTKCLLYFTVMWCSIVLSFSIYFGYQSNDLSLFAFGICSFIEVLSCTLLLFHTRKWNTNIDNEYQALIPTNDNLERVSQIFSMGTERRMSLLIGFSQIIICLYTNASGIISVIDHNHASSSFWILILSFACLLIWCILWYLKTISYVVLNSSTLSFDAFCSLAFIQLSLILFIANLILYLMPQLWWVDSIAVMCIGLTVGYAGFQRIKATLNVDKGCGWYSVPYSILASYMRESYKTQYDLWDDTAINVECEDGNCVKSKETDKLIAVIKKGAEIQMNHSSNIDNDIL